MIVPMKKVSIIAQGKDADAMVAGLRSLGILHVEHRQAPKGEDIAALKEDISSTSSAIQILSEPVYLKFIPREQTNPADWRFTAKHIIELDKRLQQLEEYSRILLARISAWERWGDFDPEHIMRLAKKNIYIRLFQIPKKELGGLPPQAIVKELFTHVGFSHCAVITEGKIDLPFKEISLPEMGLEKTRARLYEEERMRSLIIDDICKYLMHKDALIAMGRNLEKQLEFREAVAGMGREGSITYLTGYIPFDNLKEMEKQAHNEKWGLLIEEPSSEDDPPVLLRNPGWIRLIEPVLKLLGVAPGYRELDVSPVFLIFFSIFFGILIGDAGYGLSYLLLTLWFQRKKGVTPQSAPIFLLFYLLTSCAIIWGILTGTFFGQDWLVEKGIKPLLPALNEPNIMQAFCFFLGALHLTIAHSWRALLKFPSSSFLADIGWIAVLWVSYFLAGTLILGKSFPGFGLALAILGMILVLFFSEPRKNVLKRLGAGFTSITFGLSFMSAFTDVVSYVRLFAVGLAGVAIANTTNAMAESLGIGALAVFFGILIRVVGHSLNIVLGPIAILVHGVRLNVLEFGLNHAAITWNGTVYKPLQEAS
jgi:V/A-type H+-transporting ATPase subunit I